MHSELGIITFCEYLFFLNKTSTIKKFMFVSACKNLIAVILIYQLIVAFLIGKKITRYDGRQPTSTIHEVVRHFYKMGV